VNGVGFMQPVAGVSPGGGAGAGAIPQDAAMMGAPIMNARAQGGPMRQGPSPPHSWHPTGKAGGIIVPVEQLTPALSSFRLVRTSHYHDAGDVAGNDSQALPRPSASPWITKTSIM